MTRRVTTPIGCVAGGGGAPAPAWIPLRLEDAVFAENVAGRITTISDVDGLWTVTMTTTGTAATAIGARGLRRFALPAGVTFDGSRHISFRVRDVAASDASNLRPQITIGVAGVTTGRAVGGIGRWDDTNLRVHAYIGTNGLLVGGAGANTPYSSVFRVDTRPGEGGREGGVRCVGVSGTTPVAQVATGATSLTGGDRIEIGFGHNEPGTAGQTCVFTFRPEFAVFPGLAA